MGTKVERGGEASACLSSTSLRIACCYPILLSKPGQSTHHQVPSFPGAGLIKDFLYVSIPFDRLFCFVFRVGANNLPGNYLFHS